MTNNGPRFLGFAVFLVVSLAFSPARAEDSPITFAGDQDYPPIEYLQNGVPKGLNVDFLKALGEAMGTKVDVQLMEWDVAQKKVLDGEIDAITTMSVTDKRKEIYDFSESTFTYQYRIFVTSDRGGIQNVDDLEGLSVGVTKGGLPQQVLKTRPNITLVLIENYLDGFRKLLAHEVDAVGADPWVGAYTLRKNGLHGITVRGEPIAERPGCIAVKKGNTALLEEINRGIRKAKEAGVLKEIEAKWAPKEMVFLSREQVRNALLVAGGVLLVILLAGALIWIRLLRKEIRLRKRAAEELEKKTREMDAILSAVQDYMYIFDLEGRFLFANRKLLDLWGLSAEQGIGRTMQDLGYPLSVEEALFDAVKTVARTGRVVTNLTWYSNPAGMEAVYENILAPVPGPDGNVAYVAGSSRDITERKRMEEEIRKSRDELELRVRERTVELEASLRRLQESNQALQDFASIASHDMQEPLRKVSVFGACLKTTCEVGLGAEGNDYLDRMLSAAGRMQSLLNSLLQYSRLTTKAEPARPVDLDVIVREVLLDLEVRIEQTGGKVKIHDLPTIEADPTQMRQLFQNLLGNALKFHREGVSPVVEVYAKNGNEEAIEIVVEDNGIGFEERYLSKIFSPFQRLHANDSTYQGTGMGLAICKKIVDRHGGNITARSAAGEGATFIVTMPVSQRGN